MPEAGRNIGEDHVGDDQVEVDQDTRSLFQKFMHQVKKRKSADADTRNILINNLHWRYKFETSELADMFRLKPRTIKEIIK